MASVTVQGGLVRPVVARLGERKSLLLGIGFGMAAFAVHGLAPSAAIFCLGIPLLALWGFWTPAAQAIMSRGMEPSEQGRLQGTLAALRGIAGMIGPGLFTNVFAASVTRGGSFAGAPYVLAAGMLTVAFGLAWRAPRA